MSCNGYPTATSMKLLQQDADTINQVVTSPDDLTTPASDGLQKATLTGLANEALSRSRTSAPVDFIDGQFNYTVPGFNSSLSAYYIYSGPGTFPTQLLIPDIDYTYADTITEEITLLNSWGGGKLIAKSLDPTGTGVVQSPVTFTASSLTLAVGLSNSDIVFVTDRGNGKFQIMPTGYTPLTGDITLNSGQVAALQRSESSKFNVEWFGADGTIDTAIDQTAFFDLAAQRATEEENGTGKKPVVVVPAGSFRVDSPTAYTALWEISPSARFPGAGGVAPTFEQDTSNLLGKIVYYDGVDQFRTMRVGDPTFTVQKYTGKGFAATVTAFGMQGGGLAGTAHTSAYSPLDQGCIGAASVVLVDTDDGRGGWANYTEAHRDTIATGNAFCTEATMFNRSATVQDTPYAAVSYGQGLTYNQWLTTGGSPSDFPDCNDSTAAIGILGKGGAKYDKGIIFKSDSVTSSEAVVMPSSYEVCWYSVDSGLTERKAAFVRGNIPGDDGQLTMRVYNSDTDDYIGVNLIKGSLSPNENNATDLANLGSRFKTIYLVNSPDVASDATLKSERGKLNDNEINAAMAIARLPRMFQWLSEIEEKKNLSGQTVYLHCSPMAQDVWSALESNGVDPLSYGFISDGDDYGAKFSLQPQEILWMICAAQQSKIDSFESRLDALEGN